MSPVLSRNISDSTHDFSDLTSPSATHSTRDFSDLTSPSATQYQVFTEIKEAVYTRVSDDGSNSEYVSHLLVS